MAFGMLPLLAILSIAQAGEEECVQCCQLGGLTRCGTSIRIYGDGSRAHGEKGAWRVIGLWSLSCDGTATFEPDSTTALMELPVDGQVIMTGLAPMALHCFGQACSLPEDACFRGEAGRGARVLGCSDGAPLSRSQLSRPGPPPPGPDAEVMLVDGKPMVMAADPREAVPVDSAALDTLVLEVPPPPLSVNCQTPEASRTESRRLMRRGQGALAGQEYQRAVDELRAAISLDKCNAYAWAALGRVAGLAGRHHPAAVALAQAVEIHPGFTDAWSDLGFSYIALDHPGYAREAFRRALAVDPSHGRAREGLERLQKNTEQQGTANGAR